MPANRAYDEKLAIQRKQTLLDRLPVEDRGFILARARRYRFTFQELRMVCAAALDLEMWGETPLPRWWVQEEAHLPVDGRETKKRLLRNLDAWLRALKSEPKTYPEQGLPPPKRRPLHMRAHRGKNIVGMCPVASEDTVCCNLRTIDAVENCGFGCSYCTIQTFYGDDVAVESHLEEKLLRLDVDRERFYHFGTGQSSDSLMWGNRWGILDALCDFARKHPNVLLELKTKSANVAYFLSNPTPPNLVLSWSVNTPTIIRNEEHFTAPLEERLAAARRAADCSVSVAFHFHPVVHYRRWREEYRGVAETLLTTFAAEEVAFVSYGTVTFIRPVVKAIRERGRPTKILQMSLTPGPKGKLSYPDPIKKEMFRVIHDSLSPWHGKVFSYLCMEKAALWQSTFGFAYPTNGDFEDDFGRRVLGKLSGGLAFTP